MNAELEKVLERMMPAVYFDGDFDQALKDLIWLYEHSLEIESAFVGVRDSYVLGFWAMLAKKHPPADIALKELGKTKINLLLNGEQDFNVLLDLFTIHQHAGTPELARDAFLQLMKANPEAAAFYFERAPDVLDRHGIAKSSIVSV